MNFPKVTHVVLLLLLLGGFIVRLYGFNNPIADWHSWRQAETSSVSRNFVRDGFDLLHPHMDNISNVQSGIDNPKGYFFVEFPIYNALQAGAYKSFGIFTIEQWGRIVSITASLFAGLFLYLLVSGFSNKTIGLFAVFFYMFIPYNIYYGRTILPESTSVMALLGGIYFFNQWITEKSGNRNQISKIKINNKKILFFILAVAFTASAFLLKPYALLFVLPMIAIVYKKWGMGFLKNWYLWIFAIFSILPLVWWRTYIAQFPEGIPANQWLLNGNGIRFRPAFFRWILYERLTKLISGYLGIFIIAFGTVKLFFAKEWLFFLSFVLSSIIYVCVFATGNVQHDYYQIFIMPSVAIVFAFGSFYLYSLKFQKFPIGRIALVVLLFGMFWFGWLQIRDYFNINNPSIIAAGKAVQRLTPKEALIVANYNGDTSLLYQMDRKGWASFQDPLPKLIEKGADYLVLINPTETDLGFQKNYTLIEKTPQYVIFDLHQK